MERTQPGGRVVLATDDANVTDWIQNSLNGVELRMSRTGKLYVKGRDGLDGELAEIFGRYPTIGQNDGIFEQVRSKTGLDVGDTPDVLVEALRKDRASYETWKRGEDAEAQHWADEQAHEEWLAQQRWEQSGMNVIDYVKSRIEEGDPEFDLDWEMMREINNYHDNIELEIERDRAAGRFQAEAKFSIAPSAKQISETTRKEFADDPVTSKWKIRVEPEAFRRLAPRPLETVKPVTESTDNNSVKKAVKKLFVDFGKVHNADDGTDVSFNPNDAGKIMMQSGIDMRTFAPQLKSLFETSTLAFESPQEKFSGHKYRQNVDWFKYYVNKFVGPDGNEKYIRFTVRIENNWTKQGIHAATVSDVAVYENENAEGRTFRAHKLRGAFRGFTDFILSHYIGKGKGGQQTFKERQFEVIQKFNKAHDDVHAWIRSVDDIKTAREAFEADGAITDGFAPDAGPEVYAEALKTGKIKVYSSKPIENCNFVTPSRMEAKNYAGNGRIYEAVLPLDSIAWLDAGQGQVAKVDKVQGNLAKMSVARDKLTETPEFKDWFGKSKVVDRTGKPRVVYHGTPNGEFTKFDKEMVGSTWDADELGFFFTSAKSLAEDYTKP